MAQYEWSCEMCSKQFETIQGIKDDTIPSCPECGGPSKRLISASNLQFKGLGWTPKHYFHIK